MPELTAVFDACVLYPAPLRDLLMRLAATDLFNARWTDRIHEEWIRHLLANRPDLSAAQVHRTRKLMDAHILNCLVTGYEGLIELLTLPDPDDRHVLAAAIHSKASIIVTFNLKDFPPSLLAPHRVQAHHPDDFIMHLLDFSQEKVYEAVRLQRAALLKRPQTVEQLLHTFALIGIPHTAERLRPHAERL